MKKSMITRLMDIARHEKTDESEEPKPKKGRDRLKRAKDAVVEYAPTVIATAIGFVGGIVVKEILERDYAKVRFGSSVKEGLHDGTTLFATLQNDRYEYTVRRRDFDPETGTMIDDEEKWKKLHDEFRIDVQKVDDDRLEKEEDGS